MPRPSEQNQVREAIARLFGVLDGCTTRDRGRIARRLSRLKREHTAAWREEIAELQELASRSAARRAEREQAIPRVTSWPDLPVSARRDEISALIRDHQAVIVCGETGSGKTTQLPKICLDLGIGARGLIGHTQPRRIAARAVAVRVAEELHVPLGKGVGYRVRFTDKTSDDAYVKVMTDGVLLAETQSDRSLERYECLIIDEAHERSLNVDFLLGYLKRLMPKRPDLKVIITSATIDPERFARHFMDKGGNFAPVIMVEGRTYPVSVRYRPRTTPRTDTAAAPNSNPAHPQPRPARPGAPEVLPIEHHIARALKEAIHEGPGDVLVFLSGEREIRAAHQHLRKHVPGVELLPLYSRLSLDDQSRIFAPHTGRRVVLSTNVAETSLTVPGIRFVIDTGEARLSRYSSKTRSQRLPVEAISRASADQRAGRCGRLGPGICYRLYAEDDFVQRPQYTDPEILRSNLSAVILRMAALNLGDPAEFPFMDAPDPRQIKDAYETLRELGAVDEHNNLTVTGRVLAKLPIDPRLGRILLAGQEYGSLSDCLVIASALSIQDPRDRPHERRELADASHAQFADAESDFNGILKLWDWWRAQKKTLGSSKLRKACVERFISFLRMREWEDVHHQLVELMGEIGHRDKKETRAEYPDLHKAILTGMLSSVGKLDENREYAGVRGLRFSIFPGSGLFKEQPDWIMAAELVRTTKLWGHTCAKIQPRWIERIAEPYIKRAYSEPSWNPERQRIEATERVTLWGLELSGTRTVPFGKIDPRLSREIFIHRALVEGELRVDAPFVDHNSGLLEHVDELEARTRRRDLLTDMQTRYDFFDARVPTGVYSRKTFEEWRRHAEKAKPEVLFMGREHVLKDDGGLGGLEQFPDSIAFGELTLPLVYALTPGEPGDGVTIVLPVEALPALDADRCEWLVPGLVRDKIIELLRNLPKAYRRLFGSAPVFADEILRDTPFGTGTPQSAISERLRAATGVSVPVEHWRNVRISDHLRMNFRVTGAGGKLLGESRDLDRLRSQFAPLVRQSLAQSADTPWSRANVTEWDFGDLPAEVEIQRQGVTLRAYPAIVDTPDLPALRLFDSRAAAERAMRGGLRRLFTIHAREEIRDIKRRLVGFDRLKLMYSPLAVGDRAGAEHANGERGSASRGGRSVESELIDGIRLLAVERAFMHDFPPDAPVPIRSRSAFIDRLDKGIDALDSAAHESAELVSRVLESRQDLVARLERPWPAPVLPVVADIEEQLALLTPPDFIRTTPLARLRHFPRYLQAASMRLARAASGGAAKDREQVVQLQPHTVRLRAALEEQRTTEGFDPELEKYRWFIEEMRVSLFAQTLRTAVPVSLKRLDEQWERVRASLAAV